MEKAAQFVRQEKALMLILTAAFLLRIFFLSPWLEDWDSVQFALALHNFSIVDHQPHPPGYPLYILLGRALNLFLHNDTSSLTLLSALLGAATVIPLFLMLQQITEKSLAIWGSLIFAVTPLHWTLSEVALTQVPGMFFLVIAALFLYRGKNSPKSLFWGSFLAGLTVGVRFAEYSILIALILLVSLHRKKTGDFIKSTLLFVFGIFVWLLPIVLDTGLNDLIAAFKHHADYIVQHDSALSLKSSFLESFPIFNRAKNILSLFVQGYSLFFLPILLIAAFPPIKNPKLIKDFNYQFFIVWFAAYFIPVFVLYNIELTRYLLPLLPPILLLAALSLKSHTKPLLSFVCYSSIVIAFCIITIPQLQKLHTIVPPTVAPVLFVKQHFNPKETVLVTTFTYRHFQYYAPEFKNLSAAKTLPEELDAKTVIVDFPGLIKKVDALGGYRFTGTEEFSGPSTIFPRLSQTTLVVLERGNGR